MPPEYSLSSLTNELSFDAVAPKMKSWEIYDNNVTGRKPKFVARG